MKFLKLAVGLLLLVAVFGELALYLLNLGTRRRAESLIAELQPLKVGVSTLQDAKAILTRYRATQMPGTNCASNGTGYGIVISNETINRLVLNHPALLRLGIRPVGFSAALTFADDHLCQLIYSTSAVIAGGEYPSQDQSLKSLAIIELNAETTVQELDVGPGPLAKHYNIYYFDMILRGSTAPGRILGMRVSVLPSTSPIDFHNALAFDLSCFTSLRGCRTLCQMMPLAFRDAVAKHKTEGLHVPEDEIKSPDCSRQFAGEGEWSPGNR